MMLRDLGCNLVMNRSLLFVRCLEAHKSRYQTLPGACIYFLTMLATLSRKGSETESSSSAAAMWRRFWEVGFDLGSSNWDFFGILQSLPRWPNLLQLKHLFLLVTCDLLCFFAQDVIARSSITPVACFLLSFALADDNICYILSIVLSPLLSILVVVVSKLSYTESRVMTIAILSQMLWLGVKVAYSCLTKNQMSANLLTTNFSNLFGLLVRG